jgi:hypothetical protein
MDRNGKLASIQQIMIQSSIFSVPETAPMRPGNRNGAKRMTAKPLPSQGK